MSAGFQVTRMGFGNYCTTARYHSECFSAEFGGCFTFKVVQGALARAWNIIVS